MTAIVLSLLMLLGLFPLTAYATNGPSEENMSYALFYNGEESYPVYREQQAVNDSIGGATYDRGTNTVTITDFNHPELGFATNMMGDDLKLKVVGNCALSTIIIYGWGYGGGLSIIGDGTLTINSSGKKHRRSICLRRIRTRSSRSAKTSRCIFTPTAAWLPLSLQSTGTRRPPLSRKTA